MNETTTPNFIGGELLAGKYRVERVIGEGGMGVVLAARHEALATNVAIKLLRTSALEHTDVVGRFMREARAAVSLRSEHVARVFDVGNLEDGRPYIVMERLEGKDLGDVIDHGAFVPVADAVDYVMQACEAIAEAHAAGIVHRDLKPKNLFLTHAVHGRPLVKVLDFGISKIETRGGAQEMQLTRTTEVIGSPSYMSPEQLRSSRNVDARTDIWALGVILYELLTKRVPFYAETVTELVLVVVTEKEPPVRSLRPDCPEGLEAIVARCLQKQPEHRFQSVVELVQALEPY
ncbi:MAG: serine/threonine protein kinase, partial [Myxococcales bacterium]|nr:serine/threonine protein kinase [Myxococcales bacterium]